MKSIEIDIAEGARIARLAVSYNANGPADTFEAVPALVQAQAALGVVHIVRAMQELGYRISFPLKAV